MKLNKITLLISAVTLFGSNTYPIWAQIVPQTGAVSSNNANHVPVVNINKPGSDGVSHNIYNQFDVGASGAILNNSSTNSNTALAGLISGNNNLSANGSAKVILNEINSANKSILNGMVEVAGQRADVVIANKSGITCNGCGFINANKGILTTADLQFDNGSFSGYQVNQGNIRIEGAGLKKGDVDYTALISRTAEISAAVRANTLLVSAGKKDISSDITKFNDIDVPMAEIPEVLIDVSELGGMYANKISLIANEKGVGSNVIMSRIGSIGEVNGIQWGTNGTSTNNSSRVDIANRGHIEALDGNIDINTKKIVNQGVITADSVKIKSSSLVNKSMGKIESKKNTNIDSSSLDNNGTINVSEGALTLKTSSLSNATTGKIEARDNLSLVSSSVDNDGIIKVSKGPLTLKTSSLSNSETGKIEAQNDLTLTSFSLDNNGLIKAHEGAMSLQTFSLSNDSKGVIEAKGDIVNKASSFSNKGRISSSHGAVKLTDSTFSNSGNIEAFKELSHTGIVFDNKGTMRSISSIVTHNGKEIIQPANDIVEIDTPESSPINDIIEIDTPESSPINDIVEIDTPESSPINDIVEIDTPESSPINDVVDETDSSATNPVSDVVEVIEPPASKPTDNHVVDTNKHWFVGLLSWLVSWFSWR